MLRIGPNAASDEQSAINIIQDTQRVGIQKDPTGEYILDVSGAINCGAIFVDGAQLSASSGSGLAGVWTQDGTTGDISYGGGNVSISGDLHVIGDISGYIHNNTNYTTSTASLVSYSSSSGSSSGSGLAGVWTQDASNNISYSLGNVGIGTTDPSYALDVSGDMRASGDLYTNGDLYADSDLYANGDLYTTDGDLFLTGDISMEGDLLTTGDMVLDGSMVIGKSSFDSSGYALDVSGDVQIVGGLDVSGYLKVPFGSSNVSSTAFAGYIRYNDVSNEFQGYDASENVWSSLGAGSSSSSSSSSSTTAVSITNTNADVFNYSSGTIDSYTFLSDGSIMSNIDITVDVFMVGGGGGGGSGTSLSSDATTVGGGGGAGGVYEETITLTGGVTYTIVIGTGGIANIDGNDTEINVLGSTVYSATGGTRGNQYGGGQSGIGNSGGVGSTSYYGGGGGGQGGTGGAASSSGVGDGGSGITNSLRNGVSLYYAGGGGGGSWNSGAEIGYGSAGGGDGVGPDSAGGGNYNPDAEANTGSGGGGGGRYSGYHAGGTGGSGIVIFRIDNTQTGTSTSDDRLKHNEEDISGLELITQLHPQKYLKTRLMYEENYTLTVDASGNYTNLLEGDSVHEEMGIIAQDILKIPDLSFCVIGSNPYLLKYDNLFVLSIQAIKELKAKNDALQTSHDTLQTSHDALKSLLQSKGLLD